MNIKKVMHKDRHGAQVSVEFDPQGTANPKALGVLQEFFKVAVPQMGGIPEHPGSPKGTDTVPAWLTPGEFVMNAEATRMFEPQIQQMNEAGRAVQRAQGGTIPEYKADGGGVDPAPAIDVTNYNSLTGPQVPTEYQNVPEWYKDVKNTVGNWWDENAVPVLENPSDTLNSIWDFMSAGSEYNQRERQADLGQATGSNRIPYAIESEEELAKRTQALREAGLDGGIFAPTPDEVNAETARMVSDFNRSQQSQEEMQLRELEDRRKRAEAMGLTDEVNSITSEINNITNKQGSGTSETPETKVKPLIIDGKEVTASNFDSFIPTLTKAGEDAAKEPGLFKSAMNWVDENFGGILNSDDLKKMALYYLGSRAFGNSHEGSANWVGTMFVKDAQAREDFIRKAAASGKYDEASIEKFKQTRNYNDLKPKVSVSDIGDRTTYYVDGEPMLLSKITLDNGTVYYENEEGKQISRKRVRTSNDYNAEFDRVKTQVSDLTEGVYNTRYPLKGDNADKSESMRSMLPPASSISQAFAQHLMSKEGGVANVDKVNLVNNVLADMERDIALAIENGDTPPNFASAAAVVPYINAQVIRAKTDELFKGVSDVKRAELGNYIAKRNTSKMPSSAYISTVLDEAMKEWKELDDKTRNQWNRKGDPERGTNGFYEWFLNSE